MGIAVTIHGGGFTGVGFERGPSAIHLGPTNGPTNVTDIVIVSESQITCTLPERDPSWPDVIALWITTPLGVGVNSSAFIYQTPPPMQITGITPTSGSRTGGTTVVITGKSLTDANVVEFDCFGDLVPMASFTVDSSTQITAVTQAGVEFAPYGVRIKSPTEEAAFHVNDASRPAWAYIDTTPHFSVDSVTPDHGSLMGGYTVVALGSQLNLLTGVEFAGLFSISGSLVGTTEYDLTMLDVVAASSAPGDTSFIEFYQTTPAASFPFTFDPLAATGVLLDEVTIVGGETESVYGTSIDATVGVTVDGVTVAFTIVSAGELTFVTPTHAAGPVVVELSGADLGWGVPTTDITITYG